MKLLIFVICFIVATAATCIPDHGNGRPSCGSERSIGKSHRNNWDPTAYWLCQGKNQVIGLRCNPGLLFCAEAGKCVAAHEWNWTPTCLVKEVEDEPVTDPEAAE